MYCLLKRLVGIAGCCFIISLLHAQQVDLFKMQDSANKAADKNIANGPVINTFYSTRLVNAHTVEITGTGSMDFRINHRFSPVNQGIYELFGLDGASMRFGFDFGIAKDLMIGVGRTSFNKEYDGLVKYRLMHQSIGNGALPLSIAVLGSAMYKTIDMDPSLKVSSNDVWPMRFNCCLPANSTNILQFSCRPRSSITTGLSGLPVVLAICSHWVSWPGRK